MVNVFNHCFHGVSSERTRARTHARVCFVQLQSSTFVQPHAPFWTRCQFMKMFCKWMNVCMYALAWVCVFVCRLFGCKAVNHHLTTILPAHFLEISFCGLAPETFLFISLSFCSVSVSIIVLILFLVLFLSVANVIFWLSLLLCFFCSWIVARAFGEQTRTIRERDERVKHHLLFVFCAEWHSKVPLLLAKLFN